MRRTVHDLYVPRNKLPPARLAPIRDELLALVRETLADPRRTTSFRLNFLALAVLPLAQILLGAGTHRSVVIGHAAELLESMFLRDALRDSPELLAWFADE